MFLLVIIKKMKLMPTAIKERKKEKKTRVKESSKQMTIENLI